MDMKRLKRWAEQGDDPFVTYCAGNRQFSEDVSALIGVFDALLKACKAAEHALRSYQYGNTATDLARDVADACTLAIDKAEGGQP